LLHRFVWTGSNFDHYRVNRSLLRCLVNNQLHRARDRPNRSSGPCLWGAAESCILCWYRPRRNGGSRSTDRRQAIIPKPATPRLQAHRAA
jgi:hypothetical protein